MKIRIQGFRCHLDAQYTIENNKLVLLRGDSGKGKSTVFSAIAWCLYGSLRNVYHALGSSSVCRVTLELSDPHMGDIQISRAKRPERFSVKVGDSEYTGETAQDYVSMLFGTKDIWSICNFLPQNGRCRFLDFSPADRLNILNTLSFCSDDPRQYLDKVDKKLRAVEQSQRDTDTKLETEEERFQHMGAEYNKDDVVSSSLVQQEKERIETLEKEVEDLSVRLSRSQEHRGKISALQQRKAKIEEYLSSVEQSMSTMSTGDDDNFSGIVSSLHKSVSKLSEDVYSTKRKISYYQDQLKKMQKSEKLAQEVSEQPASEEIKILSPHDVAVQEQMHNQCMNKISQIGWTVDPHSQHLDETISARRKELQDYLTALERYSNEKKKYEQLQRLDSDIATKKKQLHQECTKENYEKTVQKRAKIASDIELSKQLLECPSCGSMLRWSKNGLQEEVHARSSSNVQELEEQKTQLDKELTTMSSIRSLQQRRDNIAESLTQECVEPSCPQKYRLTFQKELSLLSGLTWTPKPWISSETLRKIQEKQEVDAAIQIRGTSSELFNYISTLKEHYQTKTQELDDYRNLLSKVEQQRQELESITTDLASCNIDEHAENRYPQAKKELEETRQRVARYKNAIAMHSWQSTINDLRKRSKKLQYSLVKLRELRKVLVDAECTLLNSTIAVANTILEDVCTMLFDSPITVRLSLSKTTKTTKTTKSGVFLSVNYQGIDYEGVQGLSGGETDRVSLALMLALTSMNRFPFLLLDEPFSALDDTSRGRCISAIRQYANKGVLCINHEDNEAYYDCAVDA
jgi:DNA repair exonuclease SbcCD ATPase subunit